MRFLPSRPQPSGPLAPDSIEVEPRRMRAGDTWCQSFGVTGYPREVGPGWLSPLLGYPGPVDVALHVEPVPNEVAASHLRRQMARLESTRRIEASKLRLADPELEAAAEDARELAAGIARGEGRLFKVGLYLTVRAGSPGALEAEARKVRSLAASLLLDARRLTFRQVEGWVTTLPLGVDPVALRRTFDSGALASCFPFASAELNHEGGILYGRNASTGGLVFLDRFRLENHNQVVLARSGAGKSYFAKLTLLRSLYHGIEVLVVDPENEYARLAEAVGGSVVRLGAEAASRLNPLDISNPGRPDALLEQSLFVHTLVQTLVGELSSEEKALLDRAILRAYQRAGITADPTSHSRPAPLLADLKAALDENPEGISLARRLEPFVSGSHRVLFDGPTSVGVDGHLCVFSLRDLPEEMKPAATLLALEAIWKKVTRGPRTPRMVVVDEAWWLLRSGLDHAARFLYRLAKSARKNWCGLTTITQDVDDVLGTDLGQAVITNASSHVLMGQSPQAVEALAKAFALSQGEISYLLTCDQGQGLLAVGNERVPLRVEASSDEHEAVTTTSPAELAERVDAR
ncbi:MAG: VirB4-like conjugal transfer ATPase, CD1110 family [Actinomycetota bacterium]